MILKGKVIIILCAMNPIYGISLACDALRVLVFDFYLRYSLFIIVVIYPFD